MRLLTNASDLSSDAEVADWLFESASYDLQLDPLEILLQREVEDEADDIVWFAHQYHN